jgi:hypothetical protein
MQWLSKAESGGIMIFALWLYSCGVGFMSEANGVDIPFLGKRNKGEKFKFNLP